MIFIRHGKAAHNLGRGKEHCFAGSKVDNELTDEGIENAKNLTEKIKEIGGCDLIVRSNLLRSGQTAEIIAKEFEKPVVEIKELSEIDIGDFAGHTEGEVKKLYPDSAEAFYSGDIKNWHFPNGENFSQVAVRIGKAIEKIKTIAKQGGRIVISGHGMINRLTFYLLEPDKVELWQPRSYPHDRIVIINLEGNE